MRKSTTFAAVGAAIIGLAACSNQTSDVDFWSAFQIDTAEVSPPQDLSQLVERSDLVITGKIVAVSEGPVKEGGYDEYTPIAQLDVQVDGVVSGDLATDTVKVIVARLSHASVDDLAKDIPSETVTMFLSPVSFGDYYSPSANVGVVVEMQNGTLETVQEPESSNVITSEVQTEAELVEAVRDFSSQ